jgi:hypothetical protein
MTIDGMSKGLERTAEEFILGSTSTERNDSHEKMTNRPLLPYVVLALGIVFLGGGFWILASVAFAAHVILTATLFDKISKQNNLLPTELSSTSLH